MLVGLSRVERRTGPSVDPSRSARYVGAASLEEESARNIQEDVETLPNLHCDVIGKPTDVATSPIERQRPRAPVLR